MYLCSNRISVFRLCPFFSKLRSYTMLGQTTSLVVVLIICNCLIEHRVYGAAKSFIWQSIDSNKEITAQDTLVSASSDISCAIQCKTYWNCVTFAFQPSSGRCHLNPTLDENTASDEPTQIYRKQDPICNQDDAPTPNAVIVPSSLKQTLTSYELNVTCADGFRRANTDIVALRCFETGQWESKTTDICKQQIWQNCEGSCGLEFEVPGRVDVGWKVYVAGQPTTTDRFMVNILVDSTRMLMHLSCVLDCCGLFETCHVHQNVYGSWQLIKALGTFPFAVNQPFVVIFAATDVNEMEIYVDGSLYTTFTTPLPVTDITRIELGNVAASYVDLWYSSA